MINPQEQVTNLFSLFISLSNALLRLLICYLAASGSITLFGKNGDSGKRPLKKGFVREDIDKFMIECIDLGELKKINIEHDNTGLRKHWLVDRVEVKDTQSGQTYNFPCNKWLSKIKEDGELQRDLFPLADERSLSRGSLGRSPRGSARDMNRFDSRDGFGRGSSYDKDRDTFERDMGRELERGMDVERGFNKGFERDVPQRGGRGFDREIRSSPRDVPRGSARDLGRDIPRGSARDFERDLPRGLAKDFEMEIPRGLNRDLGRDIPRGLGKDFEMDNLRGSARNFEREMGNSFGNKLERDISKEFGRDGFERSSNRESRGFEREMMRR